MSTIFYDSTVYTRVGDDFLFSGGNSFPQGQSFTTPAGSWTLDSLKLTVRSPNNRGSIKVTADLWADNGASIPNVHLQNLATSFVVALADSNPHTVPITITNASLSGSTRYWIFCTDPDNSDFSWQTAGTHSDGEFNAGQGLNAYPPLSDASNGPTMMQVAGDVPSVPAVVSTPVFNKTSNIGRTGKSGIKQTLITIPEMNSFDEVRQAMAKAINDLQLHIASQLPVINHQGQQLKNVGPPTAADDVVTLKYLQSTIQAQNK